MSMTMAIAGFGFSASFNVVEPVVVVDLKVLRGALRQHRGPRWLAQD